MTYRIDIDPPALRELQKLPRPAFSGVLKVILALPADPRPQGSKSLTGVPGGMRVRAGDYRVLYVVDDAAATVTIYRIGHRRDVYER